MLTDKKVAALRPKERRYIEYDADHLYVEVLPSGTKSWIFRASVNCKPIKNVIGRVGEIDLYTARVLRDELRQKMHLEAVRQKALKDKPTFRVLAAEWLHIISEPSVTERTSARHASRLDRYVFPVIGDIPACEVNAPAVLAILRSIEAQGYTDLPHDVSQLISMIFRYGVSTGVVDRDCTADLRGALRPRQTKHMASLTKPEDVGGLMRSIGALEEGPVKWSLLISAYTFARPSEVRKAVWTEIDLDRAEWRLPPERMKMRRPHIVPLSRQALDVLKRAKAYAYDRKHVFPALRGHDCPLSDMACLAALRRLGYAREQMSVHGFRSMASTILNEHSWNADAIERQLAHVRGDVREVYNYAQFLDIRRPMMQWYADYLDALRDGRPEPEKPRV